MSAIFDRYLVRGYNVLMETEGLLKIPQVASAKGCSIDAVYRAMREGRLVSVEVLGHRYVHKDELPKWTPTRGGKRTPAGGRPKKEPNGQTDK